MQHGLGVVAVAFDNACLGNVKLIREQHYGDIRLSTPYGFICDTSRAPMSI